MSLILPVLIALALGVFALANGHPVSVSLWPGGWTLELALWQAVLAPCLVAFLAGAMLVWFSHLPQKWSNRRLRRTAKRLDAELAARDAALAKPN
ncbi:LapA family protein [Roseococcus sp. SYP-B2431]|uniref:lipopolysaccharide assembly protein LapA domain-containing protein n=1 Tax=Roseococcus sp. SYP-B2431 TaxID=2496640 RepID=UPI0010386A26|nr:LapA family protein [Roseococcus sp. SYP-B2431]TCH97375.1 LapA family protein [Roseococcus sp. SYP-B2431]